MSRNCFVPLCKEGYPSTRSTNKVLGIRNKTLFKAPKDPKVLAQWVKAIPRSDRDLRSGIDRVCEKHFAETSLIKYFENVMADGSIQKIERDRICLKENAVPSLFPDLPHYLSSIKKIRKPQVRHLNTKSNNAETPNLNSSFNTTIIEYDIFYNIVNQLKSTILPDATFISMVKDDLVIGWFNNDKDTVFKKIIIYKNNLNIQVFVSKVIVNVEGIMQTATDFEDIEKIIAIVNNLQACSGTGLDKSPQSVACYGYVDAKKPGTSFTDSRCTVCSKERKNMIDLQRIYTLRQREIKKKLKKQKSIGRVKNITRKNSRLNNKVFKLKEKVGLLKQKCATASAAVIENELTRLPESQQEAVRACFAAAKLKDPKGNRYSINWIYECLLVKIKSRKVYEHLRTKKILALPCIDTLGKYISKMSGQYGFQQAIFDLLAKKANCMAPEDKRGILLLDEMKLSESVSFNKKTLKVNGLVNLGNYTPEHQINSKGDHALVLMYQPFRGKWVQALAVFLSKGCASSTVLHKIVMECVILLERSGFHVDGIATDGATWNRSMWTKFGISSENVSCEHIHDSSRSLWFLSDFPHLIKNFRNCIVKQSEFWVI